MRGANIIQESENTLVLNGAMPSGSVKVSFFGGMTIGRINAPLRTKESTLLVASLEDLLATKLKAILDRAEAKDYRDISAMLSGGASLERGLGAFAKMYGKDAGLRCARSASSRMAICRRCRKAIRGFFARRGTRQQHPRYRADAGPAGRARSLARKQKRPGRYDRAAVARD